MFSHSCNGTNIFIRWKMKCTIQLGFASLNGTFHLLPHENICTIALINIHYLYTIFHWHLLHRLAGWNNTILFPLCNALNACYCLKSFTPPPISKLYLWPILRTCGLIWFYFNTFFRYITPKSLVESIHIHVRLTYILNVLLYKHK